MAGETTEKTDSPQAKSTPAAPEEGRYSHEELIEQAHNLFGVPGRALHGALHGEERKTLTKAQAKKLVDVFLGRTEEGMEENDGGVIV